MAWQPNIVDVRTARLRANQAELASQWHMAAHHYLYCLEQSQAARDGRAVRYFAAKLSQTYRAMGFGAKALYYRSLSN